MIITYFPSIYNFDPWNISECKTIGLSHIYTENYRIELCALLLWFLIVSWLRLLIASVTHERKEKRKLSFLVLLSACTDLANN